MKLKHTARPLEIKALEDNGTFEGYGSVFQNIDSYGDRILPGAFAKSIKQHLKKGTMPALLWQHDQTHPIGVWQEMKEDDRGLYMRGQILVNRGVDKADGAYQLLKHGAVKGLSIGFTIPSGGAERNKEDNVLDIKEIELWETSVVTFPANAEAQITDVRCSLAAGIYPTVREFEAWLVRDAGFTKRDAQTVISEGFKALLDRDGEDEAQAILAKLNSLLGE